VALQALLGFSTSGRAEGLRNPPPGSFDLGRSGGRFAHVDDSSAVWNNPANLVNVTNAEIQLTPSIVYLKVDHTPTSGASTETVNPWKFLPNAFGSMSWGEGRYAAGIGISVPYGLSVEWDESPSSPFHYTAPHFNQLVTVNVNPTFAVRVMDNLSVGVGLDVMASQLRFKQFYPWLIFPGSSGAGPHGEPHLRGTGWGVGGNIGVTWEFIPNHRFAFTYRSQQNVGYDGTFEISNVTPTASALGVTPESDFHTEIDYPNIIGVGYGVRLSDRVRVEINAEWLQWSRFSSLDIDTGNNNILFPRTSIQQDWKDTFTAGLGGDWQISEHLVARAGFQFYQSPVPDDTFSPSIPDSDQYVFTIGLGYRTGHHRFEAAYGLDIYADRDIQTSNPTQWNYDGQYEFNVHLFSVAYTYAF